MTGRLLDAFPAVSARYAEPWRHYHVWRHVESVWGFLADEPLNDAEACELAALFHDAVYDPRRSDNERESARLAEANLTDTPYASKIPAVTTLILATERHAPAADLSDALRADCLALLDADLAILGAADEAFDAYDAAIRAEFAHVPDELYRAGRSAILTRFLGRERLFQTNSMRDRFEAPARANLKRALQRLAAPS